MMFRNLILSITAVFGPKHHHLVAYNIHIINKRYVFSKTEDQEDQDSSVVVTVIMGSGHRLRGSLRGYKGR